MVRNHHKMNCRSNNIFSYYYKAKMLLLRQFLFSFSILLINVHGNKKSLSHLSHDIRPHQN